eukprot:2514442-Pyramimonas_sp.AAC.1
MEWGICNLSLRALLRQLEEGPSGKQLSGILLSAAAGAAWPRGRKSEKSKLTVSQSCARCRVEQETLFH